MYDYILIKLFMDTDIWISYSFYISQSIILLSVFNDLKT